MLREHLYTIISCWSALTAASRTRPNLSRLSRITLFHPLDLLLVRELQKFSLLCLHLLIIHIIFPLNQNILVIIQQITLIIQPLPLDHAIPLESRHPLRVKHMTSWRKRLSASLRVDIFDEGREEEDHVAALVHDRGAAVRAGDFAGEVVGGGFRGGVVPPKVVVAVGEVDVGLVEDCSVLEGGLHHAMHVSI
jgi:hypothetical protein